MKQTGMITWTDAANGEKDTYYQTVVSAEVLNQFLLQVQPFSHASMTYYAVTQGYVIDQHTSPSTGEFDTVAQYLKVFLRDIDIGEKFYHFIPAPVASILETQRGGKRMIQSYGAQYASYVGALRGHVVEFDYAYVVGHKY